MKFIEIIIKDLKFSFSRSSGPGGQHVNKVNTRVTLSWDIQNSQVINEDQKRRLLKKLKSRITTGGVLLLSSQTGRSQLANKQDTINKLEELLQKAFAKKKKRKPTKPSKGAILKRLDQKKKHSEKKLRRMKPDGL